VGVEIEEAIDRSTDLSIDRIWLAESLRIGVHHANAVVWGPVRDGQQPIVRSRADRTEAVARTSSSGLTSGSGLTSTAAAAGALRFGIASRRREDRARGLLGGRALGRTRVKFARAVGDGRRRGDADE
jgi:hypothetical protein